MSANTREVITLMIHNADGSNVKIKNLATYIKHRAYQGRHKLSVTYHEDLVGKDVEFLPKVITVPTSSLISLRKVVQSIPNKFSSSLSLAQLHG